MLMYLENILGLAQKVFLYELLHDLKIWPIKI